MENNEVKNFNTFQEFSWYVRDNVEPSFSVENAVKEHAKDNFIVVEQDKILCKITDDLNIKIPRFCSMNLLNLSKYITVKYSVIGTGPDEMIESKVTNANGKEEIVLRKKDVLELSSERMSLIINFYTSVIGSYFFADQIEINGTPLDAEIISLLKQKKIERLNNLPVNCDFLMELDNITICIATIYAFFSPQIEKKK